MVDNSNKLARWAKGKQADSSYPGGDERRGDGGRRGSGSRRAGRAGGWESTERFPPVNLFRFIHRDREPKHQHDMRAFVMAARNHAKAGKLSEAISWLGDTSKFGISRVVDICRASSTSLSPDAGSIKSKVSLQRVFLPLVDLAVSTEFRNSALRTETNVLFFTLYKVDGAEALWQRVFKECLKLAERGSLVDTSYTEFDRRRDSVGHGIWEPSTWADLVLPITRFMVEVTKRFRDAVLADKDFQGWATDTLPALLAKWKANKGTGASPRRTQELEVDDAIANLNRVMGAALDILRRSDEARAAREKEKSDTTSRSELFNLSQSHAKDRYAGGGYDGPGRFSRLGVRRHDNDAERISEISVAPTAEEIVCERPPYIPRNAPSTWGNMEHLKPLEAGSSAAIMDVHFRLLRQDFVEPLREAVLGYRKEQKADGKESGNDRGGVFKAKTEGGRSFLSLFVFKNVQIVGVKGTAQNGVCVSLEFDKPQAVMQLSQEKQTDYWERSGRLAVANMVVLCGDGEESEGGNADDPLLIFAVISERDVRQLLRPTPRGQIGVSFDTSSGTLSGIQNMLDRGGLEGDGQLLMLQPSNSYFAYRPILRVLKSTAREAIPFADILLPPAEGVTMDPSVATRPPRYLLDADTYDLSDITTTKTESHYPPTWALSSVNMLEPDNFPIADMLKNTTLDKAQLNALLAALSREVTLIQGPPGTGKTFVGAKVVRLLLTNRALLEHWRGPIMCVCFTNHALDQFLGDLLDAGVEGIVRVGGSCKSERLKPFLLKELSRGRKDACGKQMWELRNEVQWTDEEIRDEWEWRVQLSSKSLDIRTSEPMVKRLIQAHANQNTIKEILEEDNGEEDDDGFRQVGPKLRGVKKWLEEKVPSWCPKRLKGGRVSSVQGRKEDGSMNKLTVKPTGREKDAVRYGRENAMVDTKELKRHDQLRALDRRVPSLKTDSREGDAGTINQDAAADTMGRESSSESASLGSGWTGIDTGSTHGARHNRELAESKSRLLESLAPVDNLTWQLSAMGEAEPVDGDDWVVFHQVEASEEWNDALPKKPTGGDGGHLEEKGVLSVQRSLLNASHASERTHPSPPKTSSHHTSKAPQRPARGIVPFNRSAVKIATIGREDEVGFRGGRGKGSGICVGGGGRGGGSSKNPGRTVTSLGESESHQSGSDSETDSAGEYEDEGDEREAFVRHQYQGGDSNDSEVSSDASEENQLDSTQPLEETTETDSVLTAIENGKSPWQLSRSERLALCHHWRRLEAELSSGRLAKHIQRLFELRERLDAHRAQGDLAVLQEANVVGMTTTGVAMNQSLVEALGARIMVVEEAAEVMEAHILAALTPETQQLILIGDHLQLRPKAEVYRLTKESRNGYDLDVSMFERLVEERRVPVFDLATQRRMRPDIADLIRPAVYPNLRDSPRVKAYPGVKGMLRPLFFVDHSIMEDKSGTVASSKTNRYEAKFISGLVRYLLKQGYTESGDITVLTPYLGQLFLLRDIVGRNSILHVQVNDRDCAELDQMDNSTEDVEKIPQHGDSKTTEPSTSRTDVEVANVAVNQMIRMATVDNFQGEESKIIIISLVRSNPKADIGFLRSSNRVNVMLSRAKHGMYIIGNAGMLQTKAGTMWSESVIPTLRSKNAIGPALELQCSRHKDAITLIRKPEQFDSLAGDGGCSRACSFRLPCGHTCSRRCHPDDPEHFGVRCSEPCLRLHKPCGHPCKLLCGDNCGPCRQRIDSVDLPCGHQAKNVFCHFTRVPESIKCFEPVKLEIPGCGHVLSGTCSAIRAIVKDPTGCTARCGKPLPCGHSCAAACGRCTKLTLKNEEEKEASPSTDSNTTRDVSTSAFSEMWGISSATDRQTEDSDEGTRALAAEKAKRVIKAAETRSHHQNCTRECGRPRPCGHRCFLPCHEGTKCGPCPEKCALSCEHSSCSLGCIDPCAPCAQDCSWFCPHEAGPCHLPCGAPCMRLPRCERKLSCGHQCPSVCGEDCPDSTYCRECGGSSPVMNQVVDMLEFTTLRDHDPSIEPIVVLGCGRTYALSTLDAYLGLSASYEKIDMAEIKHAQWCRNEIGSAERNMAAAAATQGKARIERMKRAEGTLRRVIQVSRVNPSTQVYEATMAKLMFGGATAQELSSVSRMQPDASLHVKALSGLGKLYALKLETGRLKLSEVVDELHARSFVPHTAEQASNPVVADRKREKFLGKRANSLRAASEVEKFARETYVKGLEFLGKAANVAGEARTLRADAEAKLATAELHLQGVQCIIVSRKLAFLQLRTSHEANNLTKIGRQMVSCGINACREVSKSPLESVRQEHADRVKATMQNLSRLDISLTTNADFITKEEIAMVKAVAADSSLYGGVTKWYRCPNGHTYGVGDCGQLNDGGTCIECGESIGGPGYH